MIFSVLFLISFVFGAIGEDYTPGVEDYFLKFLIPFLNPMNPFDGPASISNQRTAPSLNRRPTIKQMMYYNYYAACSYYTCDHPDLSCEWCLKIKPDIADYKVINNEVLATVAIVALSEARQEIVVSFRGSTNIQHQIFNAIFKCENIPSQRNSKNIKIHAGFYTLAVSMYAEVVQKVSSYLKQNRKFKIVLTGHSMGGALARTTYFFLKDLNQFPGVDYELYTYGEPRVGNKAFADFMNSQTLTSARVVARGDIVPHIPPTSVFGTNFLIGDNYIHPQTEFWINGKKGQKFANQSFYEDPNSSMSMGPLYTLLDHYIYFDVNLASVLAQPSRISNLPFGILNTDRNIPPLPEKIEKSIGDVFASVLRAFSPWFG